jgi:acetyl/propionyl-CoA carboxylase alpha subunit
VNNIKRLAIANRGEVAVRIIHACRELGIETVLLHSEADRKSRAFRMADKSICIGSSQTSESYLNIAANVQGALAGGAQAVHPGFGFLSENYEFVEAVEKAGMIFVGPSAEAMRAVGDKVNCKAHAKRLGLPLVPGYEGPNQSVEFILSEAQKMGFPVLVKAAAGGGGRGMKLLTNLSEAAELIESAQREALAAFGNSNVFLEKYLDRAKHIEFQVFGDSTGEVKHFFERECSVQRRHQKIIEEALSPSLTDDLRRKMGEAACLLTQSVGYKGAATVEFLLQDNQYYLLEVNTRLQVEHPVTEMVLGIDLVKAQILTADGNFVFSPQKINYPQGHSIECRVYAEDPFKGGMPSTGLLGKIEWPEGPGRRFEYGFEKGDVITAFYDPMIAKIIVWDETRLRTIEKMTRVLKDTVIFGVKTNIPYLLEIINHPEFVRGSMTTRFIEKYFNEPLRELKMDDSENALLKHLSKMQPQAKTNFEFGLGHIESPFQGAWRNE